MMAYRAKPQESTGCSPNLLMLGKEIRLPIEVMSGIFPPNSPSCPVKYVQWVLNVSAEAFRKSLEKNAQRQKKVYNLKSSSRHFSVGDWVWYMYYPYTQLSLKNSWTGPCRILKVLSEVRVQIQTSPLANLKVVHIDYLKPCRSNPPSEGWDGQDSKSLADEVVGDTEGHNTRKYLPIDVSPPLNGGMVPTALSPELPQPLGTGKCVGRRPAYLQDFVSQ